MKLAGVFRPSIALKQDGRTLEIIDQRHLPWAFEVVELSSLAMVERAIADMWVRGAPLIGVTAAYGLCLALREDASDAALARARQALLATRPTAVNLAWAVAQVADAAQAHSGEARVAAAFACAARIYNQEIACSVAIAGHGLALIEATSRAATSRAALGRAATGRDHGVVNILTHCNAGALAAVEHGTALAPVFRAHDAGIRVHVWVSETRPRNQGASLTAFELFHYGVPHTVISDNAAGALMQQGKVDLCFVGADRVARNGDVCNKIGTYLKAVAARDNGVGFYAIFPYSTFDSSLASGADIVIEQRPPAEVSSIQGRSADGQLVTVSLTESPAINPAFDVTPARLISGYVTERGVVNRW